MTSPNRPQFLAYFATSIDTGKQYVGITTDLKKRIKGHKDAAVRHVSKGHFGKAIRKYGIDRFSFVVVAQAKSWEDLLAIEIILIEQQRTFGKGGYNSTKGGEGILGWKPSPAQREKLRIRGTGRKHSIESIEKMCAAQKGKCLSEETRVKIANTLRGRKPPQKAVECAIAANTGRRKRPAEVVARIRAASIGRMHTEDVKAQIARKKTEWWASPRGQAQKEKDKARKAAIMKSRWEAKYREASC